MVFSKSAGRLAAILLVTTCLYPPPFAVGPALATGGEGGSDGGGSGGAGGSDSLTGTGGAGQTLQSFDGGGGGGAGAIGGNGGNNVGSGGQGGQTAGAGGLAGSDGAVGREAGGGGGGGAHGVVIATPGELGTRTGGAGGVGGIGIFDSPVFGGGGGGGAGGYGAVVDTAGSFTSSGNIVAGAGGDGGEGAGRSGSGGTGGIGVAFTNNSSGSTLVSTGSITGGNGGAAGVDGGGGAGVAGDGGAGIVGSNLTVINSGTITGGLSGDGLTRANSVTFTGGTNVVEAHSTAIFIGNIVGGGTADTLRLGGSSDGVFNVSAIDASGPVQNFEAFEKTGTSTWTLTGTPGQSTPWTITQGTLAIDSSNNLGTSGETLTFNGGTLQLVANVGPLFHPVVLQAGGGTIDTNSFTLSIGSTIDGPGGFTKTGPGTLMFAAPMTYAGGTTVNAGTLTLLSGSSLNPTGALTVNGGTFDLSQFGGTSLTVGALSGAGGTINLGTDNTLITDSGSNTTLATAIIGTGTSGLVKNGSGILTLTGDSTFSGGTVVNGGGLIVNGSLASGVTMNAGMIGGSGTVAGLVMNAGSTIAPGNSIGTFTIAGNFTQAAGTTYQVEVNAAGQGDRINATGTATIAGGTVQVIAASGSYGPSTTYTILNATGGVTGTYTSVTSNFAFLTPSLSYDANNVFLTLALQQGNNTGFLMSAYTPNQKAVASALNQSFANASGDYATVIGALAGLSAFQGPAALNAISGEQYADFGTMNVNNSAMFMNAVGQQMALARSGVGTGQRVALAQACDIAACDSASPFSVWASGLGGFGAVAGDYNASTATYNYAGAALGIDYRIDPRFLVGIGTAYTAGNLWVDSFPGKGWTNSVAVAAYGSFTQGGFYADGLAGYAWFSNQLQRQISIPGLQPLTATGSTGANQVLGQLEAGYRIGVYAPAAATVAPFARLQGSSVTQNGFGENGAQSLSLNVQQQTTSSLRTLFGVDLTGAMPMGSDRTLDLGLRLGWQHEFASTARPITASLAGAPLTAFTVYGATPQTDAAVVSLRGATNVAAGAQMYLRYDGEVGGGTSNHAFNLGLRLQW